jgi:polyisoprenoid-binding protein YceI
MTPRSTEVSRGRVKAGSLLVLAVCLAAPTAARAAAQTYEIDRSRSEVAFLIDHMVGKVRGKFTKFAGTIEGDPDRPEGAGVEFRIQALSINTGIPRRDDHLRGPDFFDAKAFPEIVFKSGKIVAHGKNLCYVHGPLTIHGVMKDVVLPVHFTRTPGAREDVVRFNLELGLDRRDYGILWNRVLGRDGVLLGENVTVQIRLEARPASGKAGASTAP